MMRLDGDYMDDKILVHVKGVEYAANTEDSKIHVTLNVDIFAKLAFYNMHLVEKLGRKVNGIKL